MSPAQPSPLRQLADHFGILPAYVEQNGRHHKTQDASRRALLQAMGVRCATAAQARQSLAELQSQPTPVLRPTAVVRPRGAQLSLTPPPHPGRGWCLRLTLEGKRRPTVLLCGKGSLPKRLRLPPLPLGYHRTTLEYVDAGRPQKAQQQLIVTPPQVYAPAQLAKKPRSMGLWANLYTTHNKTSWGFGDLTCLSQLARWAARHGAAFVGVNPLHALRNGGLDISPYSPVSRIYRNMLYLDVQAIPEFKTSAAGKAMLAEPRTQFALRAVRDAATLHYDAVRRLKLRALKIAHEAFLAQCRKTPRSARSRAYAKFCRQGGEALDTFALFAALDQHFCDRGQRGGWPSWPSVYQKPHLPAVQRFARNHAAEQDLHRFIQFELDQQLARAAGAARRAGMAVGLYQDLAVGAAPSGAEPWVYPELFVTGVSIGAPPDYYAPQGQNWGLPPMAPRQLARDGYAFWRNLLRHAFAHSGALRIDHVLGLFRLFWVPQGAPASLGAYVRYPTEDLLGIVALESHRHRALVIGEDLGTVPPEVPAVLRRWGLLSSRVMYFEKESDGAFKKAAAYPRAALVTATTHDHVPIGGFIAGEDCRLRRSVGHIPSDAALRRALRDRHKELQALRALVAPRGPSPAHAGAWVAAVHRFLRRTPAALVGLSLDDLSGETMPVNIPGVAPDVYPCWARRMARSLEALAADPHSAAAFAKP